MDQGDAVGHPIKAEAMSDHGAGVNAPAGDEAQRLGGVQVITGIGGLEGYLAEEEISGGVQSQALIGMRRRKEEHGGPLAGNVQAKLDGLDASDPSSINFYEPTYWTINGQRIHRSHLIIMRGPEVPDILKPTYLYGGISIPQMIYERVYGAERTANEAPQLTMTKRMKVLKMDAQAALANQQKFEENLAKSIYYQDNYSVFAIDK